MRITEDVWLSQIIEKKVFKVTCDGSQGELKEAISAGSEAMYYTKIGTERVSLLMDLCQLGFYPVDVNVTFEWEGDRLPHLSSPPKTTNCTIGEIASGEEQEVLEMARSCFQYSRFHLDPGVDNEIADRIKYEWVLNYIHKKRGDRLLVASVEGKPVGFLAAIVSEVEGEKIGIIDLIGIDKQYQRQGIGQALCESFRDDYQKDCDRLRVGTQVANIPSQRLYQKLGFSLIQTQYVLHKH